MSTVRLAYLFAFDLSEASPSNAELGDFRPVVSRGVDIDVPPSETWAEMSFVERAPYSGTMVPAWANTVVRYGDEGTYITGVQSHFLRLEYYFRPQDFSREPPRPLGKDTIQLGVVLPDGVSVLQPKPPLQNIASPDAIFCSPGYDSDGYWKASLTMMVEPSVPTHLIADIRVFVIVGGEPVPKEAFWTNFVLTSERP